MLMLFSPTIGAAVAARYALREGPGSLGAASHWGQQLK